MSELNQQTFLKQAQAMIVVPCYNEAKRLKVNAFREFADSHPDIDFLFVNDGSKDNTVDILEELCEHPSKRLHFLDLKVNQGKAEAVRQGMQKAFCDGYAYAGYFDADLATPLDEIPQFITKLDNLPQVWMVMGSRVRMLGRRIKRKTFRHYLGRIFATVVSLLLRLPVYDTQCGAKMFRNNSAIKRIFDRPFVSRWIFDVEIIKHLLAIETTAGGVMVEERFYELPLESWEDVAGSKLKSTDFFKAFIELIRIQRIDFVSQPVTPYEQIQTDYNS